MIMAAMILILIALLAALRIKERNITNKSKQKRRKKKWEK